MINNIIKNIEVISDTEQTYGYAFSRAIAITKEDKRFQLCAENLVKGDSLPYLSEKWIQEKVDNFLKTDKTSFCSYNRGEGENPLTFMKFIEENNYHYGIAYNVEVYKFKGLEVWEFHGNLQEISCAFCFYIFDKKLAYKVKSHIKKFMYKE